MSKHQSYWFEKMRMPRFRPLQRNLVVDVVVVGGGITGATAAYTFKRRGHRVALVERYRCGGVDTGHTSAHLTCVTDLRLHVLAKRFGKATAKAVWEAGMASLDQIWDNLGRENIDCDFSWVPGYLHAAPDNVARSRAGLRRDARLGREIGFDMTYVDRVPYFGVPGVRIPNQARFHPMKYVAGLLARVPGNGSYVFENTEATEFSKEPLAVIAGQYRIHCAYLVLATHVPLMANTRLAAASFLQTRLYPYTTYVVGAHVQKGVLPDALFWDTTDPYYYLRLQPEAKRDFLVFGGEDHKTGQASDTEAVFRRLGDVLRKRIGDISPTHHWSGQVIATNDGLPFMGETAERQFAITGCSGNGMTLGTIGALMAVDAYEGQKNPWTEIFNPHRKRLRGGTWQYLKENRDYPYYLLRDHLGRAEGTSLRRLKRNQGKILNLNGRKVAAYRNRRGRVTLRSPVCTHLGCVVAWNNAEQTWDCPCHGSRFTPNGNVLAGPAEEPLALVSPTSHDKKIQE